MTERFRSASSSRLWIGWAATPVIYSLQIAQGACRTLLVAMIIALGASRPAALEQKDQVYRPIPLRTYRICNTSPFALYGRDELSPGDMSATVVDPAPIVDASVLQIKITLPSEACDGPCRAKVIETLVTSLNLWRQQCLRCGAGMFAFVADDEFVYVEQNVARPFADTSHSLVERLLKTYEVLLSLRGDRPTGDGHVFGSYVRIERKAQSMAQLCTSDLAAPFRQIWPGALKTALCGPGDGTEAPMLRIGFRLEPPCGQSEWVACGQPASGIEIGLKDSAFVVRDDPAQADVDAAPFVLGDPSARKIDLETVFIHEIGHYLGLGHLQTKNAPDSKTVWPVMLDTPDDNSCISLTETMMLNSAASAGWRHRARPCNGFRRPRTK